MGVRAASLVPAAILTAAVAISLSTFLASAAYFYYQVFSIPQPEPAYGTIYVEGVSGYNATIVNTFGYSARALFYVPVTVASPQPQSRAAVFFYDLPPGRTTVDVYREAGAALNLAPGTYTVDMSSAVFMVGGVAFRLQRGSGLYSPQPPGAGSSASLTADRVYSNSLGGADRWATLYFTSKDIGVDLSTTARVGYYRDFDAPYTVNPPVRRDYGTFCGYSGWPLWGSYWDWYCAGWSCGTVCYEWGCWYTCWCSSWQRYCASTTCWQEWDYSYYGDYYRYNTYTCGRWGYYFQYQDPGFSRSFTFSTIALPGFSRYSLDRGGVIVDTVLVGGDNAYKADRWAERIDRSYCEYNYQEYYHQASIHASTGYCPGCYGGYFYTSLYCNEYSWLVYQKLEYACRSDECARLDTFLEVRYNWYRLSMSSYLDQDGRVLLKVWFNASISYNRPRSDPHDTEPGTIRFVLPTTLYLRMPDLAGYVSTRYTEQVSSVYAGVSATIVNQYMELSYSGVKANPYLGLSAQGYGGVVQCSQLGYGPGSCSFRLGGQPIVVSLGYAQQQLPKKWSDTIEVRVYFELLITPYVRLSTVGG